LAATVARSDGATGTWKFGSNNVSVALCSGESALHVTSAGASRGTGPADVDTVCSVPTQLYTLLERCGGRARHITAIEVSGTVDFKPVVNRAIGSRTGETSGCCGRSRGSFSRGGGRGRGSSRSRGSFSRAGSRSGCPRVSCYGTLADAW